MNNLYKHLSDTRKRHQSQTMELECLVTSSQELARKQTLKFKEQVDKLVMADTIIEQLIVDNDNLTGKLNSLRGKSSVTDT